jgi:hypothetical protein
MTTLSFNSKYSTLEQMLKDRSYCVWLMKQPWFHKRSEYDIVKLMFIKLKPIRSESTPINDPSLKLKFLKAPVFTFGKYNGQSAEHDHDTTPASFYYRPERCKMCEYMKWLKKKRLDEEKRNFVNAYFEYIYEFDQLRSKRSKFKYLKMYDDDHFEKQHKTTFEENIQQDLIAAAMQPNRIKKQIDQFDDIEAYFESIGC